MSRQPLPIYFASLVLSLASLNTVTFGHHPNRESQPVYPRVDLIGPLGNRLPESHRRRFNRPTYLGGKLAYHVAPTSQEAIAWHKAEHRGAYANRHGRYVPQYFYPKPWEVLQTGSRPNRELDQEDGEDTDELGETDADRAEPLLDQAIDTEMLPLPMRSSEAELLDSLKLVEPLQFSDQ